MGLTIGLFGTCGGSQWRAPFVDRYVKDGVDFFNPQKQDWKPEDAVIEAEHLVNDLIILSPITSETYGFGSLAEVGFLVQQATLNRRRSFVIMIAKDLDGWMWEDNPLASKESSRTRVLVTNHLKKQKLDNLYIAESVEDMLTVSLTLLQTEKIRATIQQFNPSG